MRLMSKAFDPAQHRLLTPCPCATLPADRFQGALLSNVDEFALNAAGLIATEAGCLLADVTGQPKGCVLPANLVVTNPRLLKPMLARD